MSPLRVIGLAFALFAVSGCAAFKQDVKTVLDANAKACILASTEFEDSKAVMAECAIVEAALPFVDELLSVKRATFSKMIQRRAKAAERCGE